MSIAGMIINAIAPGAGTAFDAARSGGGGSSKGLGSSTYKDVSSLGGNSMGADASQLAAASQQATPQAQQFQAQAPVVQAPSTGNAMGMTPEQWNMQARELGFRDAEQMKNWQMQQNGGPGKNTQQPQEKDLLDVIRDKIGQGVDNAMSLHPKNLMERVSSAWSQATNRD